MARVGPSGRFWMISYKDPGRCATRCERSAVKLMFIAGRAGDPLARMRSTAGRFAHGADGLGDPRPPAGSATAQRPAAKRRR